MRIVYRLTSYEGFPPRQVVRSNRVDVPDGALLHRLEVLAGDDLLLALPLTIDSEGDDEDLDDEDELWL